MDRPRTLSASFVKTVKQPGRYGDGRGGYGLSLLVKPTANGRTSKTWAQRLRIGHKPVMIGLGSYPVVTLSEARTKALENRRAVEAGRDPRGAGTPTFAEAAEAVIAIHAKNWRDSGRSAEVWRSSLQRFAYPRIGATSVAEVTSADVTSVLLPIWVDKPETARRLRQRISLIMRWAIAGNHRSDDPAGAAIGAALPKQAGRVEHLRAVPHGDVADAIAAVAASDAWAATKLAFEFLILTACRSGEARGARWNEIDTTTATWTIPAERTKTATPHRVPLSRRATEVLTEAAQLADRSGLVFPSPTGRQLSDSTISKLCRQVGVDGTPHGMRTAFRSWAAERGAAREVAEAALGHVVRGVEGAYQRSDLLDARRQLMEQWATYIQQPA